MAGKVSKYNAKMDAELKMRVLDVLSEASDGVNPTLDWIKQQDPMGLGPHSTQKIARILGSLVEMGMVVKGKSKSLNRMVYRLTSKMTEDGYDDVVPQEGFGVPARAWNGIGWDVEDELGSDGE